MHEQLSSSLHYYHYLLLKLAWISSSPCEEFKEMENSRARLHISEQILDHRTCCYGMCSFPHNIFNQQQLLQVPTLIKVLDDVQILYIYINLQADTSYTCIFPRILIYKTPLPIIFFWASVHVCSLLTMTRMFLQYAISRNQLILRGF